MRALRILAKFARFWILTPKNASYLRRVQASELFDADFYRGTHGMNGLAKRFPARHFVVFGEALGYAPNPGFLPGYYLKCNPDVAAAPISGFEHYITIGHREGRPASPTAAVEVLPNIPVPRIRPRRRDAPYAVVVHIYYHELWEEFSTTLQNIDVSFDLYVTITDKGAETDALIRQLSATWPKARVFRFPNRGRDIFPFLHVLGSGALDGYRAIAKLHTKKSLHRLDGDTWRQHLVAGILPGAQTSRALAAFLRDRDALVWVADGQLYAGDRWWGSNREIVRSLLSRVEIRPNETQLSFPAGSIYWLKPVVATMLRGMSLSAEDFQDEEGQVDGTTAHGVERALGYIAEAAGGVIRQSADLGKTGAQAAPPRPTFVSAFYLPQFHPIPENDSWWGEGYTEWQAVADARPQFAGHQQPVRPGALSWYDLRVPEVMERQAKLATAAGIDAFCIYHYWFDGRRVLETPLVNLRARPDLHVPYYLCWANESWRRNWDGLSGEVLLAQSYQAGFARALARSVLPDFRDHRYARPDGRRPRFVIYRPGDIPNVRTAVLEMRAAWADGGFPDVEVGAVLFHLEEGMEQAKDAGFDFWIEMPPHGLVTSEDYLWGSDRSPNFPYGPNPGFRGLIYDYRSVAESAAVRQLPQDLVGRVIPGVMPSWDNTARRGADGHIAYGGNPAHFRRWLASTLTERCPGGYRGELFINAWNEWAEKSILEPSRQYGSGVLEVATEFLTEHRAIGARHAA